MKDAYYFSHDSNARNDQRLMKLRMKYGPEGYGIYFMIIEILRDIENYTLYISDVESICFDIRADTDKVLDIIKNYNLFVFEGDYFYSKSLSRRMEKLDRIKEIRRESGKKGAIASAKVRQVLKSEVTNVEQVKKSKEKNSKVKENKENKLEEPLSFSFDLFWNLYDFKQLKPDCEDIWLGKKKTKRGLLFDDDIRQQIMDHLPLYVENTYKDGSYPPRKHPKTYLNNNGWEDEVVVPEVVERVEFQLDGTGKFYKGYCEKCTVSDFYEEKDLNGDSRCCNAKLLPKKPKNTSNNGRINNLVAQSKRFRRHIKEENSSKTSSSQIGQILGSTIENFKPPISEEEENGQ